MPPTPAIAPPEARSRAAATLVAEHGAVLRRIARRHSMCLDDAEDAYQRALLVALRKAPATDPAALVRWMQVVTRREAWAVRRARERGLGAEVPRSLPAPGPGPPEEAERRERTALVARALATLKPAERRALGLRAAGLSYAEIAEVCGWSYTKVNRCLAEGRAALRRLSLCDGS